MDGGGRRSGVLSSFARGALVCAGAVRDGCLAGRLYTGFREPGVVAGWKQLALLGPGDATGGAGLRVPGGRMLRRTAGPAARSVARGRRQRADRGGIRDRAILRMGPAAGRARLPRGGRHLGHRAAAFHAGSCGLLRELAALRGVCRRGPGCLGAADAFEVAGAGCRSVRRCCYCLERDARGHARDAGRRRASHAVALEGGQSCPQPPFRRPEPAKSRLRPRLAAPQSDPLFGHERASA